MNRCISQEYFELTNLCLLNFDTISDYDVHEYCRYDYLPRNLGEGKTRQHFQKHKMPGIEKINLQSRVIENDVI